MTSELSQHYVNSSQTLVPATSYLAAAGECSMQRSDGAGLPAITALPAPLPALACTLKSPTTPVTLFRFQICGSRRHGAAPAELTARQGRAAPGAWQRLLEHAAAAQTQCHSATPHLEHRLLVAADVAEEAVGGGAPGQAAAQHRAVGQHQAAQQGEVVLAHSV